MTKIGIQAERPDAERWYRTPVARGFAELSEGLPRVDRKAGIIRGFLVMETGLARGHGHEVDGKTLDAVVSLTAGRRVKMRFGHPGMSDDAIGTSVGRGINFRRDEDRVIGDAQLIQAAKSSPKGDLWTHLLDLAEEAPDLFGNSLVIKRGLEERLDEKGEPLRDADGEKLPPFIRPTEVLASDFVDGPATTSGIFSETNVLLSAEAYEILETVLARPDAPERIRTYLDRFDADHPGAAATLRAALAAPSPGDPQMSTTDAEPGKAELTHDEMAAQLREAGFKVGKPAPAPEATPEPSHDAVLAELKELRAGLEAERKARLESEAKAAEAAAKLASASFKARLDKLTHVDAALREQAAGHVETMLAAGQAKAAEKLVAAYEAMPDIGKLAQLDTEISVPLAEGGAKSVSLAPYRVLRDGEDGPEAVLEGDREELAAAALIDQLPTREERDKARLEHWKSRGGAR